MRHIRLAVGSGGPRRKGRMIKHRQHQANKLRKLAARCDSQIIKLLKRKKSLLALAAKLEEDCYEPDVSEMTTQDMVKFGFARDE